MLFCENETQFGACIIVLTKFFDYNFIKPWPIEVKSTLGYIIVHVLSDGQTKTIMREVSNK